MKKYILPCIIAILLSFGLGKSILDRYGHTQEVFSETKMIYVLQQGVYSSLESAKENTKNISHYVYVKDKDHYRVYVGMTKNKENAAKLEVMYKKMGNNIYIKEIAVNNTEFLEKLNHYDELIQSASEYITMVNVMEEVLADYEKLVVKGESSV